jgi:DNA-directed RNA polymerase subunit RPC12/RpoP
MGIVDDVRKALEGWATWQRLLKAADKVDELERQVAELRGDKAAGPPREACPRCGERRFIMIGSTPDDVFGPLGVVTRSYRCTACGLEEARQIDMHQKR